MKNLFLFCLLALFCMPSMKSQSLFDLAPSEEDGHTPLTWSAGVGFGYAYNSVYGDDTNDEDGLSSLSFEFGFNVDLTDNFAIQTEIEYANQGYSYNDLDVKLTYLNVPILADYELVDGLSLQAGPQFGFNLCARSIYSDFEQELDVETFDLGVGVGAQYHTDWNGLFFNVRYTRGFSDIYQDSCVHNQVISATAGLFIIGNQK